jgi:hypothetical protein
MADETRPVMAHTSVMGRAASSSLESEQPMTGVAIVRLVESPTFATGPAVVEAVLEAVEGAALVVLTGPGWQSSAPAWETTSTIVRTLKASGVDVSIARTP